MENSIIRDCLKIIINCSAFLSSLKKKNKTMYFLTEVIYIFIISILPVFMISILLGIIKIVLAASEFEIMSKALCSAKGVKTKRIGDISETILGVFPKIIDFEVSTPFWINTPLHDWKTTRIDNGKNVKVEGLDWWFAYNSIKHDEKESIKNATFENAVLALASLYIIEIYLMKELFGNMSIIYTYPTVYFKCKYLPHSVSSGEGLLPDEGGLSPTERYKKECPELFKKYEIESK